MKQLTKEDFTEHPELNVQGVEIGSEVEEGTLLVNDASAFNDWAGQETLTAARGGGGSGGNPPPPVPFP